MENTERKELILKRIETFKQEFKKEFKADVGVIVLNDENMRLSLNELEVVAAKYSGLTDIMRARTRKRKIAVIRHCMFAIAYQMDYTLENIGAFFGDWDHNTVRNAKISVQNLLDVKDKAITSLYEELMRAVYERKEQLNLLHATKKEKVPSMVFAGLH